MSRLPTCLHERTARREVRRPDGSLVAVFRCAACGAEAAQRVSDPTRTTRQNRSRTDVRT